MARANEWPDVLSISFDAPVHPKCPSACCWRTTCPDHQQRYALEHIFAQNKQRHFCPRYERNEQLLFQTTGVRSPRTVEELLEILAEKRGMYDEDDTPEHTAEVKRLRGQADASYQKLVDERMEAMRRRMRERERQARENTTGQSEIVLDPLPEQEAAS